MEWLDEEFFHLGAYQALAGTDKILLGKGGRVFKDDHLNTSNAPVFYLKDFFQNSYLQYQPKETKLCTLSELESQIRNVNATFEPTGNEDEIYQLDFQKLSESFGPSLEKVVLLSREEYKTSHPLTGRQRLFLKSLQFGAGLAYGFWSEDYGITGSTPELLFTLKDNKLTTFALAGTARQGQEEELLKSEKDRHEHQLVIQDIQEKLMSLTEEVRVGTTSTMSFKNLVHLKTDIEAMIPSHHAVEKLINTLSPTAALGGYPQESSLHFLQDSQYQRQHPNRYFGSAMGLTFEGETQALVMIRNVQWEGSTFFIESGGGVVAESKLSKELEEIHLKRAVIRGHYL